MTNTEESKNIEYLDMEGLQLYDSLIKAKINTNKYNDTDLKSRITANENAIITLNGDGEGSVKKQIVNEVAKIVAGAPESRDTLKEISDWIDSHANSASEMNSQINSNKGEITTLKTLIGTLPEGSSTIVSYIAEAIGVSQTDLTSDIVTAKSEAISTATADAKIYTDNKIKELSNGQIETNKSDIANLQTKIESLESVTYTPITTLQINSLFED